MRTKNSILTGFLVLAAGLYVYFFTNWFAAPRIQILVQNRIMPRLGYNRPVYPVSFTLDHRYRLGSVTVIAVSALATNKNPAPVWALVSSTNSAPTSGFFYGLPIRGMRPAVANARPQPLDPNETYRLRVRAGRAKGEIDFKPRAVDPTGS